MLAIRSWPISIVRNCRAPMSSSVSVSQASSSDTPGGGPVERSIREKLTCLLSPSELSITNDSWQHRHHAAMRAQGGPTGETHFSVQVVSEEFRGKTTMQRHRMIYAALSEQLSQGLHALSLKTKTPEEQEKAGAS
ncbi:bola-domain-containing protein [Laetiporus sulphureus 93-53]|uniref:Bola-domain-containing protein n=1 Tax=Laetiporus sulphureus 93-53 TaxID=1314785 RepID=A0A165F3V4_9APHY|nr:bola-domain-containing protein [Laetiporus sulphureus 93-53]KZT08328.1 bola-domain-containing protein [Laetiporus sulphureus 93-53]